MNVNSPIIPNWSVTIPLGIFVIIPGTGEHSFSTNDRDHDDDNDDDDDDDDDDYDDDDRHRHRHRHRHRRHHHSHGRRRHHYHVGIVNIISYFQAFKDLPTHLDSSAHLSFHFCQTSVSLRCLQGLLEMLSGTNYIVNPSVHCKHHITLEMNFDAKSALYLGIPSSKQKQI